MAIQHPGSIENLGGCNRLDSHDGGHIFRGEVGASVTTFQVPSHHRGSSAALHSRKSVLSGALQAGRNWKPSGLKGRDFSISG